MRHELCLVDVDYQKAIDFSIPPSKPGCKIEATKPPLPTTVLVHYFNPAISTEEEILLGPIFRLMTRRARSEFVGVRSCFSSPEETASLERAYNAPQPPPLLSAPLVDEQMTAEEATQILEVDAQAYEQEDLVQGFFN